MTARESEPSGSAGEAPRTESHLHVVGAIAAGEAFPSTREKIKGALDDTEMQAAVEGFVRLSSDKHNLSAEQEQEVFYRLTRRIRTPRGQA